MDIVLLKSNVYQNQNQTTLINFRFVKTITFRKIRIGSEFYIVIELLTRAYVFHSN